MESLQKDGYVFEIDQRIHPALLDTDHRPGHMAMNRDVDYGTRRMKQAPWSPPPPQSRRQWRTFKLDVDFDTVNNWWKTCRDTHGDCCNNRHSDRLACYLDEIHLIDVKNDCLVTLPSTTPYVALSYVWGQNHSGVELFSMNSHNIETLKKHVTRSDLPATIRNAMEVVSLMKQQYLWVDRFCVVQDADPETMNTTLKAMAYIYASAEFTIVAAMGGHADRGLPGIAKHLPSSEIYGMVSDRYGPLRGVVNPPKYRRYMKDVWDKPTAVLKSGGYPDKSPWAKRGWTFQESLFSRRLLVFDGLVTWMCGRCFQSECCVDIALSGSDPGTANPTWASERLHLGVPMGLLSILPKLPSLGRWGMMIEDYSTRGLTYDDPDHYYWSDSRGVKASKTPTDIVRAFKGATEVMGPTFPGGFLHGLPLFLFDIAMLWQLSAPGRTPWSPTRRISQPSWSWLGWKEDIDCLKSWCPHYARLFRKDGRPSDWMVMAPLKPVATYRLDQSDKTQPDFNGSYTYQALRNLPDLLLPSGWQRHQHDGGHYYSYCDTEEDDDRYNFPLSKATTHAVDFSETSSSYLLCTTPSLRTVFSIVPAILPNSELTLTRIRNRKRTARASFVLPTSSLRCLHRSSSHRRCYLLAISEVTVVDHDRLSEHFSSRFAVSGKSAGTANSDWVIDNEAAAWLADLQSYYNVLWVEQSPGPGIAYRKALGMIKKEEWDALGAETKTVKLG